jgi:Tfp pilus assembly protein PilN
MGNYLSAGGASTGSSGALGGWDALIGVAVDFGVQYFTAKSEGRKNEEFLRKMAELDEQQAVKLKKLISDASTEVAKTKVIIDFLNKEEIKKLEAQRKKERMLPLIGLGVGVILLAIVFYKLKKQNG